MNFRVARLGWLCVSGSAMVEVAIWRQIRNAMEIDCFNGSCLWVNMVQKSFREKVLVLVVCPCANDVSGRRRQSDKGYRVPVDHLHQVCVCMCLMRAFCCLKGLHGMRRLTWWAIPSVNLEKISGDQRRSIEMTQKRRLWVSVVLQSVRAWQEGGVAQYQFGVWVMSENLYKEKFVLFWQKSDQEMLRNDSKTDVSYGLNICTLSLCHSVSGAKAFGHGSRRKNTRFCFWVWGGVSGRAGKHFAIVMRWCGNLCEGNAGRFQHTC